MWPLVRSPHRSHLLLIRTLLIRSLSTAQPAQTGPWRHLSLDQQRAWQALGWTETSWTGRSLGPLSAHQRWQDLTTEQRGAAQHGLGWSEAAWNSHQDHPLTVCSSDDAAPAAEYTTSSITQAAWSAVKTAAPVVGTAIAAHGRHNPALAMVGQVLTHLPATVEMAGGQTVVNDVETCLYLDDSGSMRASSRLFDTRLMEAKRIVKSIHPMLEAMPTRVLKFGSTPTVLASRETSGFSSTAVQLAWDGSSGTTYLWKMIEDDVLSRYLPGDGKLRLIVLTDGHDTDSPGAYHGMHGVQNALIAAFY